MGHVPNSHCYVCMLTMKKKDKITETQSSSDMHVNRKIIHRKVKKYLIFINFSILTLENGVKVIKTCPAGIWCQDDVVSTLMRRNHVASALIRRHFRTKCPLGGHFFRFSPNKLSNANQFIDPRDIVTSYRRRYQWNVPSYSPVVEAGVEGRETEKKLIYSRLSLSRRDPLKHFEISVLRHIRCAELRKIPNKQPNFTNEHVI